MGPRADFDMPLFERLEVETQASCNRECWFCPRTFDESGVYRDASGRSNFARMPTETVLDVLDQARALGFTGLVSFFFYSEPLLDRRNIAFARAARESGMRPYLHTNGDPLRSNDALAEEVQDTYEFVVVGLYDYQNAGELAAERAWWRARLPRMAKLGFSYVRPVAARDVPTLGIPRALVPTDARAGAPDVTFANGPCSRPLLRMLIRHDGAMCNCCEDLHAQFGLGSIYDTSLAELWYSERHQQIARDLLTGARERYPLCAMCPLRPTGPPPAGAPVGMRRRNLGLGELRARQPSAARSTPSRTLPDHEASTDTRVAMGNEDLRFRVDEPSVLAEEISGEVLAIDNRTGAYASITGSGVAIWNLLTEGHSPAETADALAKHHDADIDVVRPAVMTFVDRLVETGLVVADERRAPSAVPSLPGDVAGSFAEPQLDVYTDMEDLLLFDPIHEVDERGWPNIDPGVQRG